jgi:hypothetical protein
MSYWVKPFGGIAEGLGGVGEEALIEFERGYVEP